MPSLIGKRKVRFSIEDIEIFNRSWPASPLFLNGPRAYWFEFDQNGDLIDTDTPEWADGPASLTLSEMAKDYLTDNPYELPADDKLQHLSLK